MTDYFTGSRLNRQPYLLRCVGYLIILFMLVVILSAASNFESIIGLMIILFAYVAMLSATIFIVIQSIKRLHDLDKSGWYVLIRLISIIPFCWIAVLVFEIYLFAAEGTNGPNRFGPDPLGREDEQNNNAVLNSEVIDAEYEDMNETENSEH